MYTKEIIKLYENSEYATDLFKNNNLCIFTKRMVGKTNLSALILLQYINQYKDVKIFSLSHNV